MNTVIVACKIPNGLILEMGAEGSDNYQRVVLNGPNSRHPDSPLVKTAAEVAGGYGLTTVDEKFMAGWLKKHSWLPAVKNGMVFIQPDLVEAQAKALDTADNRSGLERLNPKDAPKGVEADADHMKQVRRETPPALAAVG